jgi:hypothetical protein
MTEDRDLLPWILGGLSMAAIAMAVAVGLTGRTTRAHAFSQSASTVPTLATAQLNPHTPSASVPASTLPASTASFAPAPSVSIPQTQPEPAPNPPGSQIWECTTNGTKTFSNNRCGSAAILREVGPINVMDRSPVAANVHWYGPDSNDSPDYYYPDPPRPADNASPIVVGMPYLERRRPQHPHQPNNHERGHPRRN